jgi:DNA repair exonuclease SbcCD nuclease subunit
MIPGNHDAALAAGVWTRARQLDCVPGNVRPLLQPGTTVMEEIGCVVLAAPLTQRQTHSDLTGWFDDEPTPEGLLRIGLAHGSVGGILPGSVDPSNPIAADRATSARLDYLALGDWHGTRRIDARTWYSGTPEPDRFKGNDAGNVLQVDIGQAGAEPQVTVIPVGSYAWQAWERQIGVASDLEELGRHLDLLAPRDVVALRLVGQVDLEQQRRLRDLIGAAQGRTRALEADLSRLRLRPTDADIAALAADGYLGEVLAELREAARGHDTDGSDGETSGGARTDAGSDAESDAESDVGSRAGSRAGSDPDEDADEDAQVAAEALGILAAMLLERQP